MATTLASHYLDFSSNKLYKTQPLPVIATPLYLYQVLSKVLNSSPIRIIIEIPCGNCTCHLLSRYCPRRTPPHLHSESAYSGIAPGPNRYTPLFSSAMPLPCWDSDVLPQTLLLWQFEPWIPIQKGGKRKPLCFVSWLKFKRSLCRRVVHLNFYLIVITSIGFFLNGSSLSVLR